MAYGEFGAISPDGRLLAYTPVSTDFATWKRYRGGMAPDIWLFDLANKTAENITNNEAKDSQPMWHGSTIYFLSDRDPKQRDNLWAYDTKTKETRQITHYTNADVHFPSAGPDELIYENDGRLFLLDFATEQSREVKINVVTDRATLRPRMEHVANLVRSASISPTGKRVLFEARGDIFSVPAEHGIIRNLTETSGVAERFPAWSPDGRSIAYFSDKTGEYELTIRPADGKGEEQTITNLGPGFRYTPQWSPDSKKIIFIDKAMRIYICDLETKKWNIVGKQLWMYEGDLMRFEVSWSADSRFFAYAADQDNRQTAITIVDTKDQKLNRVTSGFYDDDLPVFDPDGRYLYYRSKRIFQPIYSESDNTWIYTNGQSLIAVPLRKDVPSPLAPRNDEEPIRVSPPPPAPPAPQGDKKEEPKKGDKPEEPKSTDPKKDPSPEGDAGLKEEKSATPSATTTGPVGPQGRPVPLRPRPVTIDYDGFEARAVELPVGGGRFDNLMAVPGRVLFRWPPRVGARKGLAPLSSWDLDKREERMIIDDCSSAELSSDGRKLLVKKAEQWGIINVAGGTENRQAVALGEPGNACRSSGGMAPDFQ